MTAVSCCRAIQALCDLVGRLWSEGRPDGARPGSSYSAAGIDEWAAKLHGDSRAALNAALGESFGSRPLAPTGWDSSYPVARTVTAALGYGQPEQEPRARYVGVAGLADVGPARLVQLVAELAAVLEVYTAPFITESAPAVVSRDLPGGAGLVDMATELSPEALDTLGAVVAALDGAAASEEGG